MARSMSRVSPCRAVINTMSDLSENASKPIQPVNYAPEILFGLMALVSNLVLIVACAWTVTTLYGMSGSWHSLWGLLMLLVTRTVNFVRD